MKKLLLIKKNYSFFPIGIAHVITALRHYGIDYDFVDLSRETINWTERLYNGEYFAVGTGGLYADFNFFTEFVGAVKQISPTTPFILGGHITSDLNHDIIFSKMPLDYAVVGEAEESLPALLFHLQNHKSTQPPVGISGIIYRDINGLPQFTNAGKTIDIRRVNVYPTWDDIDVDYYISVGLPGYEKMRAMPVLTGRGCTGHCTFCSPTNGRYRVRSVEHVMEELHRLNNKYDFDSFVFLNEIMYPTSKMVYEFIEAYRTSGIGKTWIACLRVDFGTEMLKAMKDAGCIGANCGIESGNDRVLAQMRKGITVEQVKAFFSNCKSVGLPAQGTFIMGNETETEEELIQTVDLLIEEDIFSPGGSLLIVYPGTEVYRRALEQGRITDEYGYLKSLDFSDIATKGTFRNVNYLNMSAMSDDVLFKTAIEQSRRQRTHNYGKFSARDIDPQTMTGDCRVCGTQATVKLNPFSLLDHMTYCPVCFSPVYFNFYESDYFIAHTVDLRETLAKKQRIAVYGVGTNARLLHMYDVIGLDLNKICCFIDENGHWKDEYFFNARVIPLQQLLTMEPDFILIADTNMTDLKEQLVHAGIPATMVMPLMPPDWGRLTGKQILPELPDEQIPLPEKFEPRPVMQSVGKCPLKVLFVALKWVDADPSRPLTSSFLFIDSLEQSGLGTSYSFFCDEFIHKQHQQCDEALYQMCQEVKPDFLFLHPTQGDGSITLDDDPEPKKKFFLFPRNETFQYIRDTLSIPIITTVGDAWGRDAFDRFESMMGFSEKILVLDPEVPFLKWTNNYQKYACLWTPIQHTIFYNTGQYRDIDVSFIGRTHTLLHNEFMPTHNPLHQYVYRDRFLQAMIAEGCAVFRAGGAQNIYPLTSEMIAEYFRRSKITLNFSYNSPGTKLFRGRVWEAMNCCPLLMEEENNSITKYLEPMLHYVPFSEPGDAIDKVKYFLKNDTYRQKIANAGYNMVHEVYNASRFWSECFKLLP
ncbi:MAG: radical SAM protein [Desulfuromonadaceae bacterium]|nr:radical SAM protein [Desulfuromonadaceae bacterium]